LEKNRLIRIGDFFFRYRNIAFPLVLLSLFVACPPVAHSLGSEHVEEWKDAAAIVIVLLGLVLRAAVIGYAYIKRGGLNKQVYADTLVTEGFFAVCRNPLYVGNLIVYFGVLLMHGAPIIMVLGMAFFLFVYRAIVAAEEHFLRDKFGAQYDAYCAEVPRWGFRLSRLKPAIQGMQFSFRRVLAKDYSTIANAAVTLAIIELMEELWFYPGLGHEIAYALLLGIILVTCALAIGGRMLKKRGVLRGA
jgi:protein-S-isoprenylcysteine O-methyltransferase Ste14